VGRLKKAIVPGLLLLAVYYAALGGEHSWFELRAARAAVEEEQAQLNELHRQIDSLKSWADSLQVDSVTLERIARERFGLIRPGEVLYRFETPADSFAMPTDTANVRAAR
jgi:cell division protein FtsB